MATAEAIQVDLPKLYAKQRDVFYNDAPLSVCEATTKAGKSVAGLHWLLYESFSKGGASLWLSPIYSQAETMFNRLERWLLAADPTKRIWDSNKSKLTIFHAGWSIHFKGSDNPDSIYGAEYARAVVDEGSRVKEESWHAVQSVMSSTNGPIRIIGNVKGRKNWAYRLARMAQAGEPGMAYHKLTAADAMDAGVLSKDAVENARRRLPAAVFRELYFAEPTEDGSNPFGIDHIRACVGQISTADPVKFGVDLAKSVDWTVVVGLDGNGSTCVFERWQHDSWERTGERVASLIGDTTAHIDSTGVGDPIMERLAKRCPNAEGYKFNSSSKQRIMEGLSVAIQTREVRFPDGTIVAELESFEYTPTRTGVLYEASDGAHDDCVCALALAAWDFNFARDGNGIYVGVCGELELGVDLEGDVPQVDTMPGFRRMEW